MKFITILVCILCASCQTHTIEQKPIDDNSNIQSRIDSIVSNSDFNGVILVTQDTNTLYSKVMGFSDAEKRTSILPNDRFVIGSISKQITAVLALREYEKGKITLDDKIGTYITGVRQPWVKNITIHHLLTHTHGIVDIDKPLAFKPGSQFQYSQLGYALLAQILEKVTNQSFEKLATSLFDLYGLNNTVYPDSTMSKKPVKGYTKQENGVLVFEPNSLQNYVAAGSFISTAPDLTTWNQLLYSGKLVREETLELMKTRYATRMHPVFDTVEYGYGLLFKNGEANIQIGALGYAPGFVSACYYYPQRHINLIVLENIAKNLDNFKTTFRVHTALMDAIKNERPTVHRNKYRSKINSEKQLRR